MSDLSTRYLGLDLKNPLVVSASPLSEDLVLVAEMEAAGAAAVVLPSLFEEQLLLEGESLSRSLSRGTESFPEALDYLPDLADYNLGPEGYLELIREAKAAVRIPVIASLNGATPGGWLRYAREMEQAGADALELNVYALPTSARQTSAEVEQGYLDLVSGVRANVRIPVAVKVGPFFSALPNMALRLEEAGADALVLFNRFYQADFDLEALEVRPSLALSTPEELRLRLHWVAILLGTVGCDLAVTGGVHSAGDVVKCMMAGARVAMMTSALLKHGVGHLGRVLADLGAWLEEHDYASVAQMQGSMSLRSVPDPQAFGRTNYLKVLGSYTLRGARQGAAGE
jgi:dihydroorotate dehydrogenase (fumarate)